MGLYHKIIHPIHTDIDDKIAQDFREAEEYVVAFDSVRPIYDFHTTWNLEEFKRLDHSAQSLKESLDQYTVWEKEVEKMRARQPCGILEVESRKLRCVFLKAQGLAVILALLTLLI